MIFNGAWPLKYNIPEKTVSYSVVAIGVVADDHVELTLSARCCRS